MHRRTFLLAAVALPALAVVTSACGDPTVESGDTAPRSTAPATTGHPTGADDVVVRVAQVGGFVPRETVFSAVPSLLITGDGRVFRPGMQTMQYPGPLLPPITVASITPAGIERLLDVARAEGLLTEPVPEYAANDQVADVPGTAVDLHADGVEVHHQADALGFVADGQGDPAAELTPARQHLLRFVNAASDLATTAGASELGADEIWHPAAYRIQATAAVPSTVPSDEPRPTVVAWPAGTGVRLADAATCAVGTGDALTAALAEATTLTFFTEDGVTYQVSAVGQLPGTSC